MKLLLSILLIVWSIGCDQLEGPTGPPGPQGEPQITVEYPELNTNARTEPQLDIWDGKPRFRAEEIRWRFVSYDYLDPTPVVRDRRITVTTSYRIIFRNDTFTMDEVIYHYQLNFIDADGFWIAGSHPLSVEADGAQTILQGIVLVQVSTIEAANSISNMIISPLSMDVCDDLDDPATCSTTLQVSCRTRACFQAEP